MARRTGGLGWVKRLRVVAAVALVIAALAGPGGAANKPKEPRPCADLIASPTFGKDGKAICSHLRRSDGTATEAVVFRTTDAGASWERAAATGLSIDPNETSTDPIVEFSPLYGQDHTIFVRLTRSGLYQSTDDGETFTLVDPLGGYRATPLVMSIDDPLGGRHRRVVFAQAISGSAEGANRSMLIDTLTRLRTPVTGTPGRDLRFAVPSGYEDHGKAFAIGEFGLGSRRHFELFSCNAVFTCSERRGVFPEGTEFDRIWFSGDFEKDGTIYVSGIAQGRLTRLWWSRDGGETFKRWKSAQRILNRISFIPPGRELAKWHEYGIAPVEGTKIVYLRTWHGASDEERVPHVELFRSSNSGGSWKRVAYGRRENHPLSEGTMPIMGPTLYIHITSVETNPAGFIVAPTAEHLFMAGSESSKSWGSYEKSLMTKCSTDGGRTWRSLCDLGSKKQK